MERQGKDERFDLPREALAPRAVEVAAGRHEEAEVGDGIGAAKEAGSCEHFWSRELENDLHQILQVNISPEYLLLLDDAVNSGERKAIPHSEQGTGHLDRHGLDWEKCREIYMRSEPAVMVLRQGIKGCIAKHNDLLRHLPLLLVVEEGAHVLRTRRQSSCCGEPSGQE